MKKYAIVTTALLAALLLAMSASAYATTVQVTVNNPFSNPPDGGAKGLTLNGHYAGTIPLTVDGFPALSYCENFGGTIYVGTTYTATLLGPAPDTAEWRAIAYVLTWHSPATTQEAAAENAIAVWKILGDDLSPLGSSSTVSAGLALANEASGKDVARDGDMLTWILPSPDGTANGVPGQTITFQVKLSAENGTARANCKIFFTAKFKSTGSLLSASYVSPADGVAFSGSDGIAQFDVTVPPEALNDQIVVSATTNGVWVQELLDLRSGNSGLQDLVPLDMNAHPMASAEIQVNGLIFTLPEGPLGALGAAAACVGAFLVWKKVKPSRKMEGN